jgi:hypothetical protein
LKRPKTLPAFDGKQKETAHFLLAARVAFMMGRKLEEGDWSSVYCRAKDIPERGWSNLNIDVMYQGLGVEHKMLGVPSDKPILSVCGTRLMHPAATRSIRIPSTDADPDEVMTDVLSQYAEVINQRRAKVSQDAGGKEADLRTGWMLWQSNLREFLYFEEETLPPDPKEFFAKWRESGGGSRKASKNLWVYEKGTGQKRYSITTSAGAKIQPYFDVPPPNDPNVYFFKVQGEEVSPGVIRIWIAASTARELERAVGELSKDNLSVVIASAAAEQAEEEPGQILAREEAVPVALTLESYNLLVAMFPTAVSDEHMTQLLVSRLRK